MFDFETFRAPSDAYIPLDEVSIVHLHDAYRAENEEELEDDVLISTDDFVTVEVSIDDEYAQMALVVGCYDSEFGGEPVSLTEAPVINVDTFDDFEERADERLAVETARRREVHDYGTAKRGPIVCLHGVQKEIASKIAEMRDLYSGHLEIWDDIPFRSRLPIRKMARVRVMEDADPMRVEHRRRCSSWKDDSRVRKAWAKHF